MGFLDHSTNNVILDAVLTDKGRQLLATGVGNFSIAKFAFADDEVPYEIIEQFGRTVGKEKIEKNTPVLEATTTGNLGLKYRNLSLNNNSLYILPILSLKDDSIETGGVSLYRNSQQGNSSQSVTVKQKAPAGVVIDPDNTDYSFKITCDDLFLGISGFTPDTVDGYNVATYTVPANSGIDPANLSSCTFKVASKNPSQDIVDTYSHLDSSAGNSSGAVVSRIVTISGYNSGQSLHFTVNIY